MSGKKGFAHIFKRIIAAEHNTTVEEVRREIEAAIQAGYNNPDPKVQAQWAKIPRKGDVPTPDELITYVVRKAKKDNAEALPALSFMVSSIEQKERQPGNFLGWRILFTG